MGRIGKRIHEIMILLICFAVTGTGFVTISLNLGILGLVAGLLQFALGYGGFIPVLYAWVNQFIPSSIRASATSLIATIGTGGIIVLQVLMGAMINGTVDQWMQPGNLADKDGTISSGASLFSETDDCHVHDATLHNYRRSTG